MATAGVAHADGDESEAIATTLSVAGTAAGAGTLVTAFALPDRLGAPTAIAGMALLAAGPSLGVWYGGDLWSDGLAVRLAGTAAVATGATLLATAPGFGTQRNLGGALMTTGLVTVGIGAAIDMVHAHHVVRERNTQIVPTARGVAVLGTF